MSALTESLIIPLPLVLVPVLFIYAVVPDAPSTCEPVIESVLSPSAAFGCLMRSARPVAEAE